MSTLSCHDLRVRRADSFLLDVLHLELEAGSVTAVCGPNGSGKSTLLLACAGLIDLDGGEVHFQGQPYHRGRAPAPASQRQRLVLVHQDPYLLRGTVRRNLSWGLRLRRVSKVERRQRSAEVLSALGIEDLTLRDVGCLSGGQKTLVAVARALVLHPEVLILDEVTRDLDEDRRLAVMAAFGEQAKRGAAILLATHDREIVEQVANQCVALEDGRITNREV